MTRKYHVIWISTGQATSAVTPWVISAGKSAAIDEGGKFGGSYLNYGCPLTSQLGIIEMKSYLNPIEQRGL